MAAITIEGYRLEAQHGGGAGLQLWRGRSIVRDLPVLLQVWASADMAVRDCVRALAAQRHPGLATVLDIGETAEGQLYVALAELPGPSLASQLQQGMDLPMALAALRQLAAACAHLEQRNAPRAMLDPESILLDARLRPVLTRLQPASNGVPARAGLRELGLLFFEALCGEHLEEPQPAPALPDYLQRWQPLIDGCLGSTPFPDFAALLASLDALEGRAPSRASVPKQDAAKASASPALPIMQAKSASAGPIASEQPPLQRPAPTSVATRVPAADGPRPASAKPATSAPPGAEAVPATARVTAPSKRVDPGADPAFERPRPDATEQTRPAPPGAPSRIPLYAAAAVALLALLAAAGLWLMAPTTAPGPSLADSLTPPAAPDTAPAPRSPIVEPEAVVGFEALDQVSEYELNPALEVELGNLATVVDPVEQFIQFGNTNLQAGRLIEPPQRNALDRFLLALRIEPGNREAADGVAEVGRRCIESGRNVLDIDALLAALACAERVASAHPAGEPTRTAAAALRQAALEERVRAGHEALAQWNRSDAIREFEQALRIAPGDARARDGLDRARRQGQDGYLFRDALAAGGQGPELRVTGALAWGLREVSVAEFRRFWERAGQAQFGSKLPSCRDRESLLRSSRKRGWESPDIPQTADHPVVCVNHAMATAYAAWLSAQTGARYRLPARSEWLAVAGAKPEACGANFRDQTAASAWNARESAPCSDGHAFTAPVAATQAHSGLYALWGNVGEWLSDCDGNSCREHLVAGGSWFTPADEVGVRGFAAEPGFTTIGFRVVRELPDRPE